VKTIIILMLLALVCGCSVVASMDGYGFDLDSGTADTDGDSDSDADTDTDSDTDSDVCPAGTHACVEDTVAGWNGPSVLYLGAAASTLPACGGDYPEAGIDALTELTVPSSTCDCGCGDAAGVTCAGSGTLEYHGTTSTCDTSSPSFWYLSAACTNLGGEIFGGRYYSFDSSGLIVAGGSCPVESVEVIPPVELATRLMTCGGATDAGGCTGGALCLPVPEPPFEGELCIWRSGEVLCPSGSAYDQRSMRYTDYSDTRDCATCTCGSPAGSCAGSSVTLVDLAGCATGYVELADLPGSETCVLSSSAAMTRAAILDKVADTACTASAASLEGSVVENTPITICCMAP
jgi:hypothetical protein